MAPEDAFRRCEFIRGNCRCELPIRHGGTHVMSDEIADDHVYPAEPYDEPPIKASWMGDDMAVRSPGEDIPQVEGVAALLKDPVTGMVHPVDRFGNPILAFTCHHCGGEGCDICEDSGELRTRLMNMFISAMVTGRWPEARRRGTCGRCGRDNMFLTEHTELMPAHLCIHCRHDLGREAIKYDRTEAIARVAARITPEAYEAERQRSIDTLGYDPRDDSDLVTP
jgi:hypothetical protein